MIISRNLWMAKMFEELFDDLDDLEEFENTADKNVCIFRYCGKESIGVIKFTDGKRNGEARVCVKCFERSKLERPNSSYYSCGQLLFIEELWW